MLRAWEMATTTAHGMVMVLIQRWQTTWNLRVPNLILLLFSSLRGCHYGIGTRLVRGMIQQSANVVHKERVKELGDLLLVREVECSFERDPALVLGLVQSLDLGFILTRHL